MSGKNPTSRWFGSFVPVCDRFKCDDDEQHFDGAVMSASKRVVEQASVIGCLDRMGHAAKTAIVRLDDGSKA